MGTRDLKEYFEIAGLWVLLPTPEPPIFYHLPSYITEAIQLGNGQVHYSVISLFLRDWTSDI